MRCSPKSFEPWIAFAMASTQLVQSVDHGWQLLDKKGQLKEMNYRTILCSDEQLLKTARWLDIGMHWGRLQLGNDDHEYAALQHGAACCSSDPPPAHDECWFHDFTLESCCPCFGTVWRVFWAFKNATGEFIETLAADADMHTRGLRSVFSPRTLFRRAGPEVRAILRRKVMSTLQSTWRTLLPIAAVADPHAGDVESMAGIICQFQVKQRERYDFILNAPDGCVVNTFMQECSAKHSAGFLELPPIQGPAPEGHVLDFLGIATKSELACSAADLRMSALAPNRHLLCNGYTRGDWPRRWPILDEEYFEWVDVLGAAMGAARRGDGFAMAEIGSGPFGIWAVRGAVAFHRLAAEADPCHILVVEPFGFGEPDEIHLQQHLSTNLPFGRCLVQSHTAKVRDLESAIGLLDKTGGGRIWDLVDVDTDSTERYLFSDLTPWASRVRRLHISTHMRLIHFEILEKLRKAGWTVPMHFPTTGVSSFGKLGRFTSMDGHITAIPPMTSDTWELYW